MVSKGGTYDMDDIEAEYADTDSDEEGVPHTPEARVEMYREMAEEKAEKEKVRRSGSRRSATTRRSSARRSKSAALRGRGAR